MSDFENIIISISITAIVIGICELLFPKSEFKNQMRLITGTVLLLSLISPFINNNYNFDIDFDNFNSSVNVTKKTEKSVAISLNYEIQTILEENNVNNGKIIIETGNDENGSINIKSVNILFDEEDKNKSEYIKSQINKELNVVVETGESNE